MLIRKKALGKLDVAGNSQDKTSGIYPILSEGKIKLHQLCIFHCRYEDTVK